uniref:Uncharacterized protein n=1 Tax=uncultured prokaryote TaxID=198431 RepID=A0A0H5QI11_9ZZZZ|nr:hypothetical protein [uncultured prokaryote]
MNLRAERLRRAKQPRPLRPVARSAVDNAAARGRRGQRCALTPDRPPPAHALPTAPLHRGARPPEPPAALRTAQLFKNSLEQPNSRTALRGFALPPSLVGRQQGPGARERARGRSPGGPGGGTPRRARSALGAGRVGLQAKRAAHRRMGEGGPVAPLRGAIYAGRRGAAPAHETFRSLVC